MRISKYVILLPSQQERLSSSPPPAPSLAAATPAANAISDLPSTVYLKSFALESKVSATMKSPETIQLLLKRRSLVAKFLQEPGPNDDELQQILLCATRVPDHKGISPWRIQILDRETQDTFHAKLPALHTGAPASLEKTTVKEPKSAPLLLVVSSHTTSDKAPRNEQLLSCAAVCQNILIASHALGYHSQWLTEWMAYNDGVKDTLGIPRSEEIIAFIYIGTALEAPTERPRPSLEQVVSKVRLSQFP